MSPSSPGGKQIKPILSNKSRDFIKARKWSNARACTHFKVGAFYCTGAFNSLGNLWWLSSNNAESYFTIATQNPNVKNVFSCIVIAIRTSIGSNGCKKNSSTSKWTWTRLRPLLTIVEYGSSCVAMIFSLECASGIVWSSYASIYIGVSSRITWRFYGHKYEDIDASITSTFPIIITSMMKN